MIHHTPSRPSAFANRRAHQRYRFQKSARLVTSGHEFHGRTCDLSAGGVSVQGWFSPEWLMGKTMVAHIDGLIPLGLTIAWSSGDRFGGPFTVRTQRAPELAALIAELAENGVEV